VESDLSDVAVVNNERAHRFEATVDGHRALIICRLLAGKLLFDHAEVPPLLERKGLAAKLTHVALKYARANHLRVVPLCPYVADYIRRHPEEQDLLFGEDLEKIMSQSAASGGK